MNCLWRRISTPLSLCRTIRQGVIEKTLYISLFNKINTTTSVKYPINVSYNSVRHKSKKKQYDSDEEEAYDDDSSLSRDSKLVKINSTSLRMDGVLKSALGVARNKIEQLFYESKIRINGKKVLKKSVSVKVGDEIDVIKSVSPKNSEHIYVSRVEILNLTAKEESIMITARRFKHLLIENYEIDPYKTSAESET